MYHIKNQRLEHPRHVSCLSVNLGTVAAGNTAPQPPNTDTHTHRVQDWMQRGLCSAQSGQGIALLVPQGTHVHRTLVCTAGAYIPQLQHNHNQQMQGWYPHCKHAAPQLRKDHRRTPPSLDLRTCSLIYTVAVCVAHLCDNVVVHASPELALNSQVVSVYMSYWLLCLVLALAGGAWVAVACIGDGPRENIRSGIACLQLGSYNVRLQNNHLGHDHSAHA